MVNHEADTRLAVIRETLFPTRQGYEAEPLDIDDARWLLANVEAVLGRADALGAVSSSPSTPDICSLPLEPSVFVDGEEAFNIAALVSFVLNGVRLRGQAIVSAKADPVSPSLPSDLPRVGVCYKHKAAEWQGCYTICGWCKASLHYVTVEEAERITGRQRPKDWPNNVIGYKPVSPSLDQEKQGPSCGHKTPMPECGACYVFNWQKYRKA